MPLIRIVKMTFREDSTDEFLRIFDQRKELIASFPGCSYMELLRDGNIFFTYSKWEDEAALERYRASALFAETWAAVKPLFAAKAEAWSVRQMYQGGLAQAIA
jgi:heme-degrading monooxygenase HmoA